MHAIVCISMNAYCRVLSHAAAKFDNFQTNILFLCIVQGILCCLFLFACLSALVEGGEQLSIHSAKRWCAFHEEFASAFIHSFVIIECLSAGKHIPAQIPAVNTK